MIKYSNNDKRNKTKQQISQHGQTTQPRLKVCMCVNASESVRMLEYECVRVLVLVAQMHSAARTFI